MLWTYSWISMQGSLLLGSGDDMEAQRLNPGWFSSRKAPNLMYSLFEWLTFRWLSSAYLVFQHLDDQLWHHVTMRKIREVVTWDRGILLSLITWYSTKYILGQPRLERWENCPHIVQKKNSHVAKEENTERENTRNFIHQSTCVPFFF